MMLTMSRFIDHMVVAVTMMMVESTKTVALLPTHTETSFHLAGGLPSCSSMVVTG